jgi:hypothetical protein
MEQPEENYSFDFKNGRTNTKNESAKLPGYINDIRVKNKLPENLFQPIEQVIRDYCGYEEYTGDKSKDGFRPSIRHGENVRIAGVSTSWHFNNDCLGEGAHVTVCIKTGRGWWIDDCYLDQVPVPFLLHLLELIEARRPLWDQLPVAVRERAVRYCARAFGRSDP